MRIDELQLKGFGKWQDAEFHFAPGINLFYAPNEAGKSTLLQGIFAALYGMKRDYVKTTRYLPEYEKYRPWHQGEYETIVTYQLAGKTYRLHRSLLKEREQARLFLDPEWTELTDVYQEDRRKERNFVEKHLGLGRSLFTDVTWIRREPLTAGEHLMPALKAETEEANPMIHKILGELDREVSTIGKKERAENTLLGKASTLVAQKEQELRHAESVSHEVGRLSRQIADWEMERVRQEQQRQRLLQGREHWAKKDEEWQKRWQLSYTAPDEQQWVWWENSAQSQEERSLHQGTRQALRRLQTTMQDELSVNLSNSVQIKQRRELEHIQQDYEQGVRLRRHWEEAHMELARQAAASRLSIGREARQSSGGAVWPWAIAVVLAGLGCISFLFDQAGSGGIALALAFIAAGYGWWMKSKSKAPRKATDDARSEEWQNIQQEISQLDEKLGMLLRKWQVTDWDAFLERKEEQHHQLRSHESERLTSELAKKEEESTLLQEWGNKVRTCLAREKEAWESERTNWQTELSRSEERLQEIREQIAKANGQMEAHEGVFVAQARSEYEDAVMSLEQLQVRREALKLARDMLQEALEEWNRDVSPAVNQHASMVMDKISAGVYREVRLDPREGFAVRVLEPARKQILEQEQCSTGTQDQLTFAQRLALLQHVSQQTEPLPLFLDDHFVHYDQDRLERALMYLLELGEQHQIFLFTCVEREQLFLAKWLRAHDRHAIHQLA